MWLWWSIFAAGNWALGSVLLKPAYKKLSMAQIYTLNGVSFLLIWIFYAIATSSSLIIPKNLLLILPILPPLAFITFIFAIKKGKVSIISAVSSTSPLVSTFLAIVFLKEAVNLAQITSTIIIVISLFSLGLTEKKVAKEGNLVGFMWGLIAALAFGIANATSKFVLNQLNVVSFSIINSLWMLILSLLWLIINKQLKIDSWSVLKTKEGKRGILGSTIYSFGGFFLFLALQKGLVSLVIPITNLSTPLTMILAMVILKEKITPIQRFLISLIFFGIVGLSVL